MTKSDLEETLAYHIYLYGLPVPLREYEFAKEAWGRRWRADFAWVAPEHRLLVEVEGGTWAKGRHTRGRGFEEDCHKYNAATLLGWRVLRFTGAMVNSLAAVDTIKAALCAKGDENGNDSHTSGTEVDGES